ncbi:toll-like receptor 22 [Syngnathus typhle]|uniref:toll-like receptor 22 n=1 Tax=Syngnathus typhle TaxID=161592 RepID=UPI002A69DC38|nr:toll-like receptor 22 [Syngnathus typhle]
MDDGNDPRRRLSWLSICFVFSLSANCCAGYILKDCRISNDNAICSASKLRAVPRDIPAWVKTFDLSVNKISKLRVGDFLNFTLLTELGLKRNNISQIEKGTFASLRLLQKLNLNNNRLAQLGDVFEGLSNLSELRLTSNVIRTVTPSSFKPLTNLTVLDLSFNKLQRLTQVHYAIQHLPNLKYLFLKKIDVTIFQSWELTNNTVGLAYLDLSQNRIDVFAVSANVFQNLTWLNVGGSPGRHKLSWEVGRGPLLGRLNSLDIGGLHLTQKVAGALFQSVNFSLSNLRMNAMKCDLRQLVDVSCTIPTLTQLQLRRNKLRLLNGGLLRLCSSVTELDLADNRMKDVLNGSFGALKNLKRLTLSQNSLSSVPPAVRNLSRLLELDLSSNNISTLTCEDFADLGKLRILGLYQNYISTLHQCVFKGLGKLEVLKLQTNRITQLASAFKRYLPNLRQLKLDNNQLKAIEKGAFEGLRSLQNLSLQRNQLEKLENGSFVGLTMLTDLLLQSNEIQQITAGVFNDLANLRRLSLLDNRIKYKSSMPLPVAPFSRLSRLETLAMAGQHSRGRSQLPRNFLQGLTNLQIFDTRNVFLSSLHQDTFKHTPGLQKLDISSNELIDISPSLFEPIQNLHSLYISRTTLRSLDFLKEANLTKLEFLQARRNQYSVITKEQMDALPSLVYLDLQGNSFLCECDNSQFLLWLNESQAQVFDAHNFVCNYPPSLKGMKLLNLDIGSCSVDVEFIYFISTTVAVLLFQLSSFTYHFLRWQLAYAYHLFLALLHERKFRDKQPESLYDAFVSYNAGDEDWVFRELVPKLEEGQGWKLCLHHRDFEPGKPIMENITDAIYASRKSICIISRKYLQSEWCSREIQVAGFRLFDEHKDVLILVFLEDIPIWELSPYYRMRKLVKKQTFLSWPRAAQCTDLFWEKLRQALHSRDNPGGELLLLTVESRK